MNNDNRDSQSDCDVCAMGAFVRALSRVRAGRIRAVFRPDAESTGELVGTFILVFFGLGAVHVAVLTDGLVGLGQVAAVWGVAVGVAIYATAGLSGAHLNPAITLALAVYRGFPRRKIAKYVLAQFVGAFVAAAVLYVLFGGLIGRFEQEQGIVRGGPGSERSAMVYGEYFPNPGMLGDSAEAFSSLSVFQAMAAEAAGAAMLALVVFAASQPRGKRRASRGTVAVCVGLGLAMIISVFAPLTQAGLNPARDFGPRLFSYLAGWGNVAIPGPRGGFFTVYILGPLLGGLAGGGIHGFLAGLAPAESSTQADDVQPVANIGALLAATPGTADRSTFERNRMSTQLILVGGFLGSGKTTLLEHAAERLRSEGKQIGLVTNDQATNLVDTSLLEGCHAGEVQEVAGGCFCCRFPDLVTALADLVEGGASDTILCEPVGSCTDVSATVLQPLKKLHGDRYRLTPYTVLLDPYRTVEALGKQPRTTFPDNVLYIFRKQVEEADLLVINKADITPADAIERCRRLLKDVAPDTPVLTMSALTGTGISEWLGRLEGLGGSGQRIADVDYDVYADGEAALGWLNAKVHLAAESPVNWHEFANRLLSLFRQQLRLRSAEIAHVKFRLSTGLDTLTANLTCTAARPSIRGQLDTSRRAAQLLFNARVHIAPDQLQEILETSLAQVAARHGITADVGEMSGFAPARPQPTHRFPSVVY